MPNPSSEARAQAIAAAWPARGLSFTLDGFTVVVSGAVLRGGAVWFSVTSAIDLNGIALPLDDEYGFVNPPLKPLRDSPAQPLAAAQRILLDAVLHYARAHGYRG